MIKVDVYLNKKEINKIVVKGHSNYASIGNDIVCSAVSTAMSLSIGLIERVCPKYDFKEDEKEAFMELDIIENNEFTNVILENLVDCLKGIEFDYTKYVKVNIKNIIQK